MSAKSRRKGKSGENEAARELRRIGFPDARRGQQYNGLEGRDVLWCEGIHAECKRTEALSLYAAMDQAREDAATGEVPVVLHRRSRRPWVVVLELDHVVAFAHRVLEGLR